MKLDARVRYTRRVIQEALLTLLEQKPLNKITVTELCALAQINRATFYAHYADCYAVLNALEDGLLRVFGNSLSASAGGMEVQDLMEAVYRIMDENSQVCRVLILEQKDRALAERMIAIARYKTRTLWRASLPKATEGEIDMLFTCLANGLLQVILTGYGKYPREQIAAFASAMTRNAMAMYT